MTQKLIFAIGVFQVFLTIQVHKMLSKKIKHPRKSYHVAAIYKILCYLSCPVLQQVTSSSKIDATFESCTADMQKDAYTNFEMWRCKPRDQLVKLKIPNASYSEMQPNHVNVKQCGGTCNPSYMG